MGQTDENRHPVLTRGLFCILFPAMVKIGTWNTRAGETISDNSIQSVAKLKTFRKIEEKQTRDLGLPR